MQTLVAFASSHRSDELTAAATRVEAHYRDVWPSGWQRRSCQTQSGGLVLWDVETGAARWPSWSERAGWTVASLYVPLGFNRVVDSTDLGLAPVRLAQELASRPEALLELTPPFVLSSVDHATQRIRLHTDALGLGRLFVARAPGLTVWSNRPVAACLFAGLPPRPDPLGWRYQAATGWFMGETTPIEGVHAVAPGSVVTVGGGAGPSVTTCLDRSAVFADAADPDLDHVATALQDVARSVALLWPGTPTVDLSGGRDSRLVAAAFHAAGVEVRLHTRDTKPGEIEIAEQLVALLPERPVHDVRRRAAATGSSPVTHWEVCERVGRWHRYAEGLRPASYLASLPPDNLAPRTSAVVGGAAGELAHGHFYPRDVDRLEALPVTRRLAAYGEHLATRLLPGAGLTADARIETRAQIDRVLRGGLTHGLVGATLLDFFYADERLRRWGTTAESAGVVAPLLTPAFVRAAFALTPQQRREASLHKELIARLVPAWAGVPFFAGAAPRGVATAAPFRLGAAPDREALDEVFGAPGRWGDDYDRQVVRELWSASRDGRSTPVEEQLLWRIVWQDLFHDYASRIEPGTAALPRTSTTPHGASAGRRPADPAERLVRTAQRSRLARRVRRTTLGGALETAVRRRRARGAVMNRDG